MDFILAKESEEYREGFQELLAERGYRCAGGVRVVLRECAGRRLSVRYAEREAVVEAPGRAFLFRGLMTLVMRLEKGGEEEAFTVLEEIWFDHNGCMVDCSRNCVMSVEAAKAWLRMQAAAGMNTMMLYTEDTYEVEGYPYFGALRGRYTKEELRELDHYAAMLGVELIPCIQALGHLVQPLKWPAMRPLRDTSDILLVGDGRVYEFLRACIRQVSECFSTRRVHLGMDEAWSLGLGKYLIQNGYTPKNDIIRTHMEKVMELCRAEGLEPMIWSDMYFRLHSPLEEYYDVPFETDMRTKSIPPEGMTLVYWDYYHKDEDYYRNYIRLHRQLTDHVVFAGGGWTWNGIAPGLSSAAAVTRPALLACRKEGLRDAVYTLWGDDGTETPLFAALGPVLFAAESGFGGEDVEARVREKFEFLTGFDYDTYLALGAFDSFTDEIEKESLLDANPSKSLFYQDLLLGIYDGQTEGARYGAYYAGLGERLCRKEAAASPDTFWSREMALILDFYQAFAEALAKKADLGLRISEAYRKRELNELGRIAREEIPEAEAKVRRCRELRGRLWSREGKIFGWEILDIRFRALEGRMESAAERICAFLRGDADSLPELEEKRLPVFPERVGEGRLSGGYLPWIDTVSASPLAWGWMPQ